MARLQREIARLASDFPGEAEALQRRAFWRLAARFTPWLAVDRDGSRLVVSTADQTLGRRLFVYPGTPELDIQRAFATLQAIPAAAERLPGASIVEIGANIGSHTVEMLKHFGARSVVAVEPDPGNCELLRQNVLLNALSDRVRLLALALSDHDGAVHLELSPTNSGDHRVRVPGAAAGGSEGGRSTIEVGAARFDSLVAQGVIDLDATGLIWIDAQGHEAHILRGATQLLGSRIPIVMEYWPYGLRRAGGLEALHELIAEHYSHVVDVSPPGGSGPRIVPAERLPGLESEYGWGSRPDDPSLGTDLVLSADVTATDPVLSADAQGYWRPATP
jgi:FkbM family methyltransferase